MRICEQFEHSLNYNTITHRLLEITLSAGIFLEDMLTNNAWAGAAYPSESGGAARRRRPPLGSPNYKSARRRQHTERGGGVLGEKEANRGWRWVGVVAVVEFVCFVG